VCENSSGVLLKHSAACGAGDQAGAERGRLGRGDGTKVEALGQALAKRSLTILAAQLHPGDDSNPHCRHLMRQLMHRGPSPCASWPHDWRCTVARVQLLATRKLAGLAAGQWSGVIAGVEWVEAVAGGQAGRPS
jgi:hypothetical protein